MNRIEKPSASARTVAVIEIAHLGCCHMVVYPLEVAARENSFGKELNISGASSTQNCESCILGST